MLKLAFLFLTMSNVSHENYWQSFFKGHEQQYNIYVHAKYGVDHNQWFKQFELSYTVENSWARTMKAQQALLKEALKDPDNAYFIFCSQNTIPLQSFDYIYDHLTHLKKSIFWYEKNPHADPKKTDTYQEHRALKPIAEDKQYKNAQWIILNRKHAQLIAHDERILPIISCYPHDQEHYPSTFLALHNQLHEVICRDTTLVVWHLNKQPPYIFKNLDTHYEWQLLVDAIKYGIFFVRKVDEHCNLKPLDNFLTYRDGPFK